MHEVYWFKFMPRNSNCELNGKIDLCENIFSSCNSVKLLIFEKSDTSIVGDFGFSQFQWRETCLDKRPEHQDDLSQKHLMLLCVKSNLRPQRDCSRGRVSFLLAENAISQIPHPRSRARPCWRMKKILLTCFKKSPSASKTTKTAETTSFSNLFWKKAS